jgi:hypothetical protein
VESLSNHLASELGWVQPRVMVRDYELYADDEVVATLKFATPFGSLARAETSGGCWSLKRVGFFNPRVTVREAGNEIDLAVYRRRWTGTEGELEFTDGRVYRWQIANFWSTRFEVTEWDGTVLVEYRSGSKERKVTNILKTQAIVSVSLHGRAAPDIGLLVLIGWYLIVLQQEDAAAAVVTAS